MSEKDSASVAMFPKMKAVWRGGRFVVMKEDDPLLPGKADELARLDEQVRATVATVALLAERVQQLTEQLGSAIELVDTAARCHATFADDLAEFSRVLMLPVVPVYNAKGVLIGSRRVEKLEGEA